MEQSWTAHNYSNAYMVRHLWRILGIKAGTPYPVISSDPRENIHAPHTKNYHAMTPKIGRPC